MNDADSQIKKQEELDSSGGQPPPSRRTALGYDENSNNKDVKEFPLHPDQQDLIGSSQEKLKRIALHRMILTGWMMHRNDAWKAMVQDNYSKGLLNKEEFESLLVKTENMNPEDIELLFPDIPGLLERIKDSKQRRVCREN